MTAMLRGSDPSYPLYISGQELCPVVAEQECLSKVPWLRTSPLLCPEVWAQGSKVGDSSSLEIIKPPDRMLPSAVLH